MNLTENNSVDHENPHMETYVDDLPLSRAARLVYMSGPPVLLALGTFGNGMSIMIHHRLSTKRHSTVSVYLIALAAADLMLLYSGLLIKWVQNMFSYDIMTVSDFTCKTLMWFIFSSGALCAWLLVAVTLQRAVSVVWPHRVNSLITIRSSVVVVVCITCSLMIVHVHILFGFKVSSTSNHPITKQCSFVTLDYSHFFLFIWSWLDLLLFSFVPFTTLLASNCVLLKTVVTSVKAARQKLSLGDKQQVTSREKTASSMTLTLLVISFTFVILTLPICTYQLMAPYVFVDIDNTYQMESVRRIVESVVMFMWYTNSAINFYLYCLSGSKFRTELKELLAQFKQVLQACLRATAKLGSTKY